MKIPLKLEATEKARQHSDVDFYFKNHNLENIIQKNIKEEIISEDSNKFLN